MTDIVLNIIYKGCKVRSMYGPDAFDKSKYYIVAVGPNLIGNKGRSIIVAYPCNGDSTEAKSITYGHFPTEITDDTDRRAEMNKFIDDNGPHRFWSISVDAVTGVKCYMSKIPEGRS